MIDRVMKKYYVISIIFLLLTGSLFSATENKDLASPEKFFGFQVGADYHLLKYEQAVNYWKELEKVSGKIKLFEYGKSSEGRTMVFAAISSENNIARLDSYKSISQRLSLVRGVDVEEAKKMSAEGRAIVWIDGGLHASEVAPAQHIIQLTYDLLTDTSPRIKKILDEVITMLVLPNPDGMDMVADWYESNLNTPYETSSLPWLYQKYIGHDNNRDSFMLSVAETQNINRIVNHEWYPHIFYNHHQTSPFPSLIFVPPDCEPTNPNLHPLLLRWQNVIGTTIALAFESEGKQGVISRFLFDTWYPGYVTQVCDFHNIISTFSETFLYRYATPRFYTAKDFPDEYRDFTTSLFFTNPWKGGWWRLRNAVEYCLTASKAVLELASKYREEILFAKYSMGKETVEKFQKEPPFGWIIPKEQRDPGVCAQLIDKLITLDLEVYQTEEPCTLDGIHYPEGTYILPTSQPFGRFLKTLFEVQEYPDLRKYPSLWQSVVEPIDLKVPPLRSYDVLGWTLPLQIGVKTVTMYTPLDPQLKVKRIAKAIYPRGEITGSGSHSFLIPYEMNNSVIAALRLLKAGAEVFWTKKSFSDQGRDFFPGTFIVPVSKVAEEMMKSLAEKLSLKVIRTGHAPETEIYRLKVPRIALYQSWMANMDEGWTELVLENHEFFYTIVHNAEIMAGNLRDRFDVLLIPDQSPSSIINGHRRGTSPPKYVGGISESGIRNLRLFVKEGGTLVTMGDSCDLALEHFSLPLKNVLKSLEPAEFFASGLIVKLICDQNSPLSYGMPQETAGFFAQSPTFQVFSSVDEKNQPRVAARFPEENIVLSGWMLGEKYLKNRAAVVEVQLDIGRVVLLGPAVQHRGQTVATFKFLFNSLFYSTAK